MGEVNPTPADLERMADELLAIDLRSELCRSCSERGVKLGDPIKLVVLDASDADTGLRAVSARFVCENGHVWHEGEGKARGRDGDSPILLDKHLAHRRTKEAHFTDGTITDGTTPGMFHRTHVEKDT
jgi:hypothetical protein